VSALGTRATVDNPVVLNFSQYNRDNGLCDYVSIQPDPIINYDNTGLSSASLDIVKDGVSVYNRPDIISNSADLNTAYKSLGEGVFDYDFLEDGTTWDNYTALLTVNHGTDTCITPTPTETATPTPTVTPPVSATFVITHDYIAEPNYPVVTGTYPGDIISVIAANATSFTISILDSWGGKGHSQNIYWQVGG
jgi:hypothetical protein